MQGISHWPVYQRYVSALRWVVNMLAVVAGLGVIAMILVTCADVIGRNLLKRPLPGAYDMVGLLGAITITGALPYATGVKGHVAIEFLFHKLSRRGRILVDTLMRLMSISMFLFLAWRFVQYGLALYASGEATPTLRWPVFWMAYWMALCCAVVVLVILYHLMHPGKELMKP